MTVIGWATGRRDAMGEQGDTEMQAAWYGRGFRACRCKLGGIADMYRVGYN